MKILNLFTLSALLSITTLANSKISVMTFNVENLFDTADDPGKDDHAFLPLSQKTNMSHLKKCDSLRNLKWKFECLYIDWTETQLTRKMQNLAKILKKANNNLPDILILQEVENKRVLETWVSQHLHSKYKTIELIEGKDKRGIDVAVLSKFPTAKVSRLHYVPFQGMRKKTKKDTRGILEVSLKISNGDTVSVFAVHLPAPFHPREFRVQSLKFLNKLVSHSSANLNIAAGDFNIPHTEEKRFGILRKSLNNTWKAAHLEACKNCKGTYYYAPIKSGLS